MCHRNCSRTHTTMSLCRQVLILHGLTMCKVHNLRRSCSDTPTTGAMSICRQVLILHGLTMCKVHNLRRSCSDTPTTGAMSICRQVLILHGLTMCKVHSLRRSCSDTPTTGEPETSKPLAETPDHLPSLLPQMLQLDCPWDISQVLEGFSAQSLVSGCWCLFRPSEIERSIRVLVLRLCLCCKIALLSVRLFYPPRMESKREAAAFRICVASALIAAVTVRVRGDN